MHLYSLLKLLVQKGLPRRVRGRGDIEGLRIAHRAHLPIDTLGNDQ